MYDREKDKGRQQIGRYEKLHVAMSQLNPFEDVTNWIEGLTSSNYVKGILNANHQLMGPMTVQERAKDVAKFVHIACKYLEQANNGPKEVSFLPAYYAILNLLKAYITVGPYGHELDKNRRHGASYDADINMGKFPNDFITLHQKGTIALFYQTITGENMLQNVNTPLVVKMGDVYPYIHSISAEYMMATSRQPKIILFDISMVEKEGKQRIEAKSLDEDFNKVKISTLQGFNTLFRDQDGSNRLVSSWYDISDTASMKECIRSELFYGSVSPIHREIQGVPLSSKKLLLPEEIPLIFAFFHMSNIVRYNPKRLEKLMDSKYWPMLLTLRTHGLYSFLVLFWSYVTQRCTYIVKI